MMLSRLRRWFSRVGDNKHLPPSEPPPSNKEFANSPREQEHDGMEQLLSERELSSRYCAGLFEIGLDSRDEPSPEERAWLRGLRDRLMENATSFSAKVPRLPRIAPRLMATLRDPEQYRSKEIAKMLESDPVLSGNMLKVVNSPSVRPTRSEILSIEQAVTILGNQRMREAVAAAIVSPIAQFERDNRLSPAGIQKIWPETLQTAMNVKIGAQHLGGGCEGFALYLSALAHSSGLMVLLRELQTLSASTLSRGFIGEFEGLTRSVSVAIARHWEFDENGVQLLQAWANSDRSTLESALLMDAIGFTRINNLCNRGELESGSCKVFRKTLPRYANEWTPEPSAR